MGSSPTIFVRIARIAASATALLLVLPQAASAAVLLQNVHLTVDLDNTVTITSTPVARPFGGVGAAGQWSTANGWSITSGEITWPDTNGAAAAILNAAGVYVPVSSRIANKPPEGGISSAGISASSAVGAELRESLRGGVHPYTSTFAQGSISYEVSGTATILTNEVTVIGSISLDVDLLTGAVSIIWGGDPRTTDGFGTDGNFGLLNGWGVAEGDQTWLNASSETVAFLDRGGMHVSTKGGLGSPNSGSRATLSASSVLGNALIDEFGGEGQFSFRSLAAESPTTLFYFEGSVAIDNPAEISVELTAGLDDELCGVESSLVARSGQDFYLCATAVNTGRSTFLTHQLILKQPQGEGLQFSLTLDPGQSHSVMIPRRVGAGARYDVTWRASPGSARSSTVLNVRLPREAWVPVGEIGNSCDEPTGGCFGSVDHLYEISAYEVTNFQYAEFLNAVARSDPQSLYNENMEIERGGGDGSYTYHARVADWPVAYVSFYDALRFANWLHNGKPSGAQDETTTEEGAYTLGNANPLQVSRNPGALAFLPSEDEWYKAAYYDPRLNGSAGGYFDYPTSSDQEPECASGSSAPNSANCDGLSVGDVRQNLQASSPWGTFDQGGNLQEWNETDFFGDGSHRQVRGGSWNDPSTALAASSSSGASIESATTGFRMARPMLQIFGPRDPVWGGQRMGPSFVVGLEGATGDTNSWDFNEGPDKAIDGITSSYENHTSPDTGLMVRPLVGPSVARGIQFWPGLSHWAEPTIYELWGTNEPVSDAATPMSVFDLIASGPLDFPNQRNRDFWAPLAEANSHAIAIDNEVAYESYLVLFPDVRGLESFPTERTQIGEVQLFIVPEPATRGLVAAVLVLALLKRRSRPEPAWASRSS